MDTKKEFIKAFVNVVVKNPRKFTHFANQHLVKDDVDIRYKGIPHSTKDDAWMRVNKHHDKVCAYYVVDNMCVGFGSFRHAMYECLDSDKCLADLAVLSADTRTKVMTAFLKSVFADLSENISVEVEDTTDELAESFGMWLGACPAYLSVVCYGIDNGDFGNVVSAYHNAHPNMSPSSVIAFYANIPSDVPPTPKKREFEVAVNARFQYVTNVVAESEEEAKQIAFERAQESVTTQWEFVEYLDKGVISF